MPVSTAPLGGKANRRSFVSPTALTSLQGAKEQIQRISTGYDEMDRVLGGGIVPGSAVLIGGDPGIGKSTLLLQLMAHCSKQIPSAYISGEEGVDQIRMRAERLGVLQAPLGLAAASEVKEICALMDEADGPKLIVADSIQTLYVEGVETAPGTVTQVRAAAQELIRAAKRNNCAIFIVGHVTKDGTIAGPRLLEHMVDAVLYFEGERGHHYRIIRSIKNRFGPADEIGVFDMTERGLAEVANPSALFLSERVRGSAGTAIFAGMEGTRPLLVEVQALVAPSVLASPRRTTTGWDHNRLSMVLAVLETRAGLPFSTKDVFLNITGGLKISEPAVDLAVAAALISGYTNTPLPHDLAIFGEVGLSGEVRRAPRADVRIKEAIKLGFNAVWCGKIDDKKNFNLTLTEIHSLKQCLEYILK